MNLVNSRLCAAVALVFAAGLAACAMKVGAQARTANAPEESSVVIGKAPAPPTGSEPPGVTAVTTNTEMSKSVESQSMPLPGQPNDHSNLSRQPSQNSDNTQVLQSPATANNANSGEKAAR
jgi:hypothetical protein